MRKFGVDIYKEDLHNLAPTINYTPVMAYTKGPYWDVVIPHLQDVFRNIDKNSYGEKMPTYYSPILTTHWYSENEHDWWMLYVLNTLPSWVQRDIYNWLINLAAFDTEDNNQFFHVPSDMFWTYIGDEPKAQDFASDRVLFMISSEAFQKHIDEFTKEAYGWNIENCILPLVFTISNIRRIKGTKDGSVVLSLASGQVNLFKFMSEISLKDFEDRVFKHEAAIVKYINKEI